MIDDAKSSRLSFRRWFFAAALGSAALTAHANLSLVNYNGFEVRQSGNTWEFGHSTAESTRLRGGTVLPNASVSSSQRALVASKTLPVGKGLPVDVVAKIPAANLAKALVAAGRIGTPIGAVLTAVQIAAYLNDLGIQDVRNTSDGLVGKKMVDSVQSNGFEYKPSGWADAPWFASKSQAASWAGSKNDRSCWATNDEFSYRCKVGADEYGFSLQRRSSDCPVGNYVSGGKCSPSKILTDVSEQEITSTITLGSAWSEAAASAAQKAISLGVPIETDAPTVSGPSSVPGEKTTSKESVRLNPGSNTQAAPGTPNTDPGTKTTTKTETKKAEYSGPNVTTSTTTNTVTNITNNVTNVTTTEISNEIKEDDEKPDICEKNPDALMCQKIDLDTPEGEIPKTEKRVDFIPDGSFGSGYCPTDKYQTIKGQSYLIVDWSQNCDAIKTWVKPIVIALSIFMAFMIVSGASRE